ncbi:P-type DNA transfer ATPase VirB11 [Sphingobium sp. BYY-5]|uniref:P-type DNA transfer ATPase VirB11 n=1 Tax=Sphingobium sp. BYY-5 TaxID=2926400 RepID=UPI001FA81970|nr:P-type DNA transfer ATPase VirB11 [Sphingobium sp. BYY-5]MCI4590392.1 P-type DNA transfer ATPase VirB11 [Sphingobium sp. BYY-5]MCI4591492.1 P-type DNA transfer ATPase VirB11 [Sphingobium sp. BYY-5]
MNKARASSKDATEPVLSDFPFLDAYLAPISSVLVQPDVTDIYINHPGEIWIERLGGGIEREHVPALTEASLWRLARQIASLSHQGINREHPLLSARLPDGSRVQIVAPPATRGPLAMAIRRHVSANLTLEDYAASGAFDEPEAEARETSPIGRDDRVSMLADAVRQRKTILISGGTSTGKTTFLNALIREIPREERLILIEDTPELQVDHANMVGLVAVKGELGEAKVHADDLLQASLRMRPDRIILGELRGSEAYTFLRAINTGHPGSMTTIHADTPAKAIEQLALIILQSGTQLNRNDIAHYIRSTVDLFVQLERRGGKRIIRTIADRDGL